MINARIKTKQGSAVAEKSARYPRDALHHDESDANKGGRSV